MKRILVVEDDKRIRANVLFQLRAEGYLADACEHAEYAYQILASVDEKIDLLLLDVRLSGMSGVDLVEKLSQESLLPPTIIISGEATISETVEALKLGVFDFIEKPFSRERLQRSIKNCFNDADLRNQVRELESNLSKTQSLIGESTALVDLKTQIGKVAPTNGRVLIWGESGTGKELVANAIHKMSRRAAKPFIKINCAAIPASLIEDELFGHVRGAFTDAKGPKAGLFEEAHGGTLFSMR